MESTPDRPVHLLAFGGGHAVLDPGTGAPDRFVDEAWPQRTFLLDTAFAHWHDRTHQWGSGHVVSDRGSARWHTPDALRIEAGAVEAEYHLLPDLQLQVRRTVAGDRLVERYAFRNTGTEPLTTTGLGVQTPFADLYEGAQRALDHAVHAHVFTGGSWAWVLAQPMSGQGRSLGLIVREGALHAYAVETRNKDTLSNVRGHLVLLATDRARNPGAFGGQPPVVIAPGQEWVLQWELGWYDSPDAFIAATRAPARLPVYATETGHDLVVEGDWEVSSPDRAVRVVRESPTRHRLTADAHGTHPVRIGGGARSEVLFHLPVDEMVRRRAHVIMRDHVARERPGLLGHAFVPVDTRTGLTRTENGWADWSDGSERVAMPLLLQLGTRMGWLDRATTGPPLDGWARFARAHLLDATAAPRRGSQLGHLGPRLYDSPWLAQFFHDRHGLTGDDADLDLSARILERNFELGGREHLSIGLSQTAAAVADALGPPGQDRRADALRNNILDSARYFVKAGPRLPPHEVAYEQSMVAPLLDLLTDAHRLTGDPVFLSAVKARLPWLLAFSGPQPHVRLHGVPIRHWDGYWFGADRLWGDVFPHHWSTLTACTLLRLPEELRTDHTDGIAGHILRAGMANYREDGSATCAFVMPSAVDGRAAHTADPLANDQDWHLVLWLRNLEAAARLTGD
ncbi:hypothetical protein ACIBL6_17320 [Streptomyces sp. NPDC050400]|uniref:hypothetical protein n=1 Tax=Streptomyces sp. NPDC050400 TaxID=3365610 RepID=UPI003789AA37